MSPEAYSEPCQRSKVDRFAKIVNGFFSFSMFDRVKQGQKFVKFEIFSGLIFSIEKL